MVDVTKPYFTLVIPWVPAEFRTPWHPDEQGGRFDPRSCGAFPTFGAAVGWGRDKLGGAPYSVRQVDPPEAAPAAE